MTGEVASTSLSDNFRGNGQLPNNVNGNNEVQLSRINYMDGF